MACHTREARYVLGLTTLQMNKDHDYGGVVANQLHTLDKIGMFEKPLEKPPAEYPRLPDPYDSAQPLEAINRNNTSVVVAYWRLDLPLRKHIRYSGPRPHDAHGRASPATSL